MQVLLCVLSFGDAVLWLCCLVVMLSYVNAALWSSLAIPEGCIALFVSSFDAGNGWSFCANSWCTYLLPFYPFCAATLR